jgi:hypothetical protein
VITPSIASSAQRAKLLEDLEEERKSWVAKQETLEKEKRRLVERFLKIKKHKQTWYRKCWFLKENKRRIIARIGYDNFKKHAKYCVGKYKKYKRVSDRINKRYRMNRESRIQIYRAISRINLRIGQLQFGPSSYYLTPPTQPTTDTNTRSREESSQDDDQVGVFDGGERWLKDNTKL